MEIRKLEIDFDNKILKINGEAFTEKPVIVTLPGPDGWPLAVLISPEEVVDPKEYLSLTVNCEEVNNTLR